MDRLLVSVVIPVYNAEKYLRQAIRSALEQTLSPHEVIVVDDGSTDSSREIAASFGSAVTCLFQRHQGPSAARNLATKHSSGDWIAFLDADDYWLPDKLAKQASVIETDSNIRMVYTGIIKIYPDGSSHEELAREPLWVKERLAFEDPLIPSTVMASRPLLIDHPWPESFKSSEDWLLFYRLSRKIRFAAITEPTAVYRQHSESLTSVKNWKAVLHYAQMVSREIQNDFTGVRRMQLHRKLESRLFASAGRAAREQGSPEYLRYIVKSLISWPFPNFWPARYKIFLKMLIQKMNVKRT
jgi:glycosyltransferase involved in cell wall biosynthesis